MSEHRYTTQRKKGLIAKVIFGKLFIWTGMLELVNLFARGTCVRNAVECILHSPLATIFILITISIYFWRDIRKILDIPVIMTTDAILLMDFGDSAIKWEDINRMNIYKSNILLHKKSRLLGRVWEPTEGIENRSELIGDLKRRCAERNIPITGERSWFIFYY